MKPFQTDLSIMYATFSTDLLFPCSNLIAVSFLKVANTSILTFNFLEPLWYTQQTKV